LRWDNTFSAVEKTLSLVAQSAQDFPAQAHKMFSHLRGDPIARTLTGSTGTLVQKQKVAIVHGEDTSGRRRRMPATAVSAVKTQSLRLTARLGVPPLYLW
jgi:hypothetical protein